MVDADAEDEVVHRDAQSVEGCPHQDGKKDEIEWRFPTTRFFVEAFARNVIDMFPAKCIDGKQLPSLPRTGLYFAVGTVYLFEYAYDGIACCYFFAHAVVTLHGVSVSLNLDDTMQ